MPLRLNKFLALAGLGSRRGVEEIIRGGKVAVNGAIITNLATTVDPEKDSVKVGGKRVKAQPFHYFGFHKPKNVITTLDDPEGRRDLPAYLRRLPPGVKPVGRLDYASEGLLLLTNDGDWSERIQHPSHHVGKVYEAKVKGTPPDRTLEKWRSGLTLDGKKARMESVEILDRTEAENTWLRVVLVQGLTQQIRRMCMALGHPVMKLKRVSVGAIFLESLGPGEYRELTEREIRSFDKGGLHESTGPHRNAAAVRSGETGRGAGTRAGHQRQHQAGFKRKSSWAKPKSPRRRIPRP
jgi:23S rRNA pseudouridine2605 synthase